MVNMNAADDKENKKKQSKISGVNSDASACSSTMCVISASENMLVQAKINGTSPENNDYNKHTITNGACPKVNSVSCSVTSACENGGSSDLSKQDTAHVLFGKSENMLNEIACAEGGKCLSRNSVENDNCLVNVQRPTMKDKTCDYSSSEDEECCCIYTYKGDSNQVADLPSSFFRLDLVPSRDNVTSRNSSPDMDYLEMDFDPGPLNDRYSSDESECEEKREDKDQLAEDVPLLPKLQAECESLPEARPEPPLTPVSPLSTPSPIWCPRPLSSLEQPYPSGSSWSPPASPNHQPTVQDSDDDLLLQPSFCYCISNKQSSVSIDENFNEGDAMTMVWKEQEAREKQVTQIATSACGATAVINVLLGLNVPFTINAVKQHVATKLRCETAPVAEYLLSRCNAGATHEDMIRGLHSASEGLVYARFFHMYPQRRISLTSWLSHWIRKGAVPIATVNLQRGVRASGNIPDMWHHQMIHGVGARGVYLTNPLEVQSEAYLWPQLTSPSVMLVRRDDVLSRWTPDTSLHPLIHPSRPLWRKMNVLGQVVNVIRESLSSQGPSSHSTQHIAIPASYSAGITLAVLYSSPAYHELQMAPELPIDPFSSS